MSYRKILLGVDNSVQSGLATDQAAAIARATRAEIVVSHVYAARLHDRRFADLEPGLPKEYQDPARLEQSRQTHGSLIGRGLHMISESYLAAARGKLDGIPVAGKSLEGKNYVELVRESANAYDLAVLGSRGLGLDSLNGTCPPDAMGTVCERFLRRARTDVLVARGDRPLSGPILACVDGSPESYAALRRALKLAQALGSRVQAVACFDPNFHPVAFKSIAGVLSAKDAKMFRFKEQENLHDRVIDHGLENLYTGYLENARIVAGGRGQEIETRLLKGRPAHEIVGRAGEIDAALVVVARYGLHKTEDLDIGSNAETVARRAPCSVLVVNERPEETAIAWTAEAEARLDRVPEFMRPMVRKAIESHARARGIAEITPDVVTDAKVGHGVPMPGHGP